MSLWTNLIDDFGYENLLFYGTFVVTTIAYWSVSFLEFWFSVFAPCLLQVSLLYLSLDVYGWAPVLTKYKVQPGSKRGIEKQKLRWGESWELRQVLFQEAPLSCYLQLVCVESFIQLGHVLCLSMERVTRYQVLSLVFFTLNLYVSNIPESFQPSRGSYWSFQSLS